MSTLRLFSFVRDVKNHLNYENRVFNSEEFLKTRAPGDQPFYKQVKGVCGRVRRTGVRSCSCTFPCLKRFSKSVYSASVKHVSVLKGAF